ncbi:MAG: YARHG domain-containing protein [Shimia sp.]
MAWIGRVIRHFTQGAVCALALLMVPGIAAAEMLPASDDRYIVEADLVGMSPAMLRIARNEIFARHGYSFTSADLRQYFAQFAWYQPYTKDVSLSAIEKANVGFLRRYEDNPALLAGLRPAPAPQAAPAQTTVIVTPAPTTAGLAEAQAAIDGLAAKIASLEALLTQQQEKARETEGGGIAALAEQELSAQLVALSGRMEAQTAEAAQRYQTALRPQADRSAQSPRDLVRHFPRIPWYDPQYVDQFGEFWLEARVSDAGVLLFDLKFLEPEYTTQNVASAFTLDPLDAEGVRAALEKAHGWSETAKENNVRDFFRKTVDCVPVDQCTERVAGNTSTQVDFLVLEQGATAARIIRNKGAFKEEFGVSIESAALLAAYFDYVLEIGKSTFEAGSRSEDDLDALFD